MRKVFLLFAIAVVLLSNMPCHAKSHSGDVWKGALIGAGATVVGGAVLDSMSKEHVTYVQPVQAMPPVDAYQQGYKDGFENGYKAGYTNGYKDGVKDESRQHE